MARRRPYTVSLAIIDAVLILFSGGLWLIVMLVREMYQRS
jgi:hypothetical protein